MENKGYIHVYTGNGKGKTTAAFGLAIRVLCAGGSVFIGQFVKNMKYNETKIEHLFNNVRIQQFGRGCFIEKKPAQEDIDAAYTGFSRPISPLYSLVPAWRPSRRSVLSGGRRVEWTVAGSVSVFQGFSCRYGIRLYQ